MRTNLTLFLIAILCLTAFVLTPKSSNATTYTITVNSNFFNPASQNVLVGDTIHFQWQSGFHTTTCDPVTLPGTSYPAGFAGWDSPMTSGSTDYYVIITRPGTYVYGCQPHWPGMQGTITAGTGYKYWSGSLNGGDGTSWDDALNWLDGTLPSTADSVMLNNSFVTTTYSVTLGGGVANTTLAKIVIQPSAANYIYLTLPSTNTNGTAGLTLGNGSGSPYDFAIYKHGFFYNQSGAASGAGVAFVNSVDSIQLNDSAIWVHNCTRTQAGITNKLSKASNTRTGIFRYDMPTSSFASITFSNITYGCLQLSGFTANAPYPYKKYITTGSSACNVRGDFYMDDKCYDSTVMSNNLNIGGDFYNYGKIVYAPIANPQQINFNGTTLQNLYCAGTGSFIGSRATFNNAAGFYINQPLYIDTVTMTNGNINSANGAWLGVGFDASNPGFLTRTGGIVTGQMERWYLAGTVSDSLSFPVGTSSVLKEAKVRFSTAPTTAGRIGIKFIDNGLSGTALSPQLDDGGFAVTQRSNSYWLMTGTFLTGGAIDVAMDGNGQAGITTGDSLRVIWSNNGGSSFSLQGVHKSGNSSIGRRTGIVNYFSNFYLGGSVANPLPVELSSLVASTIKNEVILDWATVREENNSEFGVERADVLNGITGNYENVGFVTGKGTTKTPQSYRFNDRNLAAGKYSYRLKQIDFNGNYHYFNLNSEVNISLPNNFAVSQNYPNPFNPTTNINYEMPFDGLVKIVVYDNIGREVKTLVNGNINAGYYKADFNASGLPSGIYFYRVNASSGSQNFERVFKMILVK